MNANRGTKIWKIRTVKLSRATINKNVKINKLD